MNPLISKARKPKFELVLRIYDLNNVPLVSGTSYVKWHLPASTSAEHRGRTEKASIKEHKVSWDYVKTIPVRLTINKNDTLAETTIHLEVVQDYSGAGRSEKITLGQVALNLAEYVDGDESADGEEGVVRRYLMQDSKINSTLKIGIAMKQIDGDRNYTAPPLKMAPVFGGITGIMAGDQVEDRDAAGSMPTVSKGRDFVDSQDMYRRTLAASWAAQPDELPADQLIEDIFAGGDGWIGGFAKTMRAARKSPDHDLGSLSIHRHNRHTSDASLNSQSTVKGHSRMGSKLTRSREIGHAPGIHSSDDQTSSNESERGRPEFRSAHEVDEFEMREDLVAWKLPDVVRV